MNKPKRAFLAMLFSFALVIMALPCLAFAEGDVASNGDTAFVTGHVASVSTTAGEQYYIFIESALAAANTAGTATITLLADVRTTATLTFTGSDITLDLNGHGIDADGGEFSVITVNGSATLTLTDSNSTASNTVGSTSVSGGYISRAAGGIKIIAMPRPITGISTAAGSMWQVAATLS